MVDITILEVHVDDSGLSASARANYDPGQKDVSAAGGDVETESASRRGSLAALVGLVFLIVVAYLRRRQSASGGE